MPGSDRDAAHAGAGWGRVLLLGTVIVWGWTFVASKIALESVTPVELFALRTLVGAPLLAGIAVLRRTRFAFERRDLVQLLIGGVIFVAHFLIQITGIRGTTASNTGWIISVAPLAIALLSAIVLGERPGVRVLAGLVIATGGVVLLVSHGDLSHLDWLHGRGDWLVLLSAFTWALYTVATRNVARRQPPLAVTVGVLVPSFVFSAVVVATRADSLNFLALPWRVVAAILFLGILGTALAQWIWQIGVARLGATKAGVFLYVEPLATTVLAVPLLGDPFGIASAIGAALILGGVWLAERRERA